MGILLNPNFLKKIIEGKISFDFELSRYLQ